MTVRLSEKTVLANFSVSRWGYTKHDSEATDQVHKANDAKRGAGGYTKRLVAKGATAKIDAVVNAARDYHKANTLPWMDDGVRILPAHKYMDYAEAMKAFRQEFEEAVEEFIKEFVTKKKEAKALLGKMYKESDYLDVKMIQSRYSWDLTILPFPDAEDFRVDGDIPELDEIKKELEERMRGVWENAMEDLGERIVEVVSRMAERLKAYKPGKDGKRAENTFKDSLVDNVRELVGLLPQFNLSDDKKLTKIITLMEKELCKHDADLLRDDPKIRQKVATSADAVLTAVADFIS